ncbi:SulP family inorganic anion transporter [Phycicoccus sp. HDW14]|uniref:SulP family inorganic anion transporter n=1 Tax=Phycicoccus sp. HDW14 TaxID=2714941 RepID=UPI00140C308B|nr:SulP family inorganic anion transporter [Phycicoccus sp. HDW14]QIM20612.1 SulP family inorganic anion transporter [Phycicoccus sp. HDW14]
MQVPWAVVPENLRTLRHYPRRHLPGDLLAGLLVAALAVPQSLGYAAVAGVPVQVGLYTLPPALLAYALLGTSRVLFVGPISTVSVLSGTIVRALSGGDVELAVRLTSALALTAGVVLVVAGLLRLGWVAQFLSEPIVTGFVAGLVVLIVVGEVPALAGLPAPTGNLAERLVTLVGGVGDFDGLTLSIGAAALLVLFGGQRLLPRVPWSLLVLVVGIVLSSQAALVDHGVLVVGAVPSGLPVPSLPVVDVRLLSGVVTGGLAIAAVGIAEGLAAVRTFSAEEVDARTDDRELVAHGAADLASGLFGGMGVGGSLSKTAANASAGAHTQLSGITSAVVTLGVLVMATGALADLPRTVLSAIVIHAVWALVRPHEFVRYARLRRNDAVAALVAFGGVLALGPLGGLLGAVAQSLLGLVYRSVQVDVDEMGRVSTEKAAWGSLASDPTRRTYRGVLVLRPSGPLFWANATTVLAQVERIALARAAEGGLRAVVLDLEATNQMDSTTSDRLTHLVHVLRRHGVDVHLVRVFGEVRGVLGRAGLLGELGPGHLWHSIAAGVKAARSAPEVDDEPDVTDLDDLEPEPPADDDEPAPDPPPRHVP